MFNSWRMGIAGATLRGMSKRDHASGLLAYVTGNHFIAREITADSCQYGGGQKSGMSQDVSGYIGSEDPVNCWVIPGGELALLECGGTQFVVDLAEQSVEIFEPGEHDNAVNQWFRFRQEERSRGITIANIGDRIAFVRHGRLYVRDSEGNLDSDEGLCLNLERLLGTKAPVLAFSGSGDNIALSTSSGVVLQINLQSHDVASLTLGRVQCRAMTLWFDESEKNVFAADPTCECWHRFPVQSVAVATS